MEVVSKKKGEDLELEGVYINNLIGIMLCLVVM